MNVELLYRLQELEKKHLELKMSLKKLPYIKQLKSLKESFELLQKNHEEKKLAVKTVVQKIKSLEDEVGALEFKLKEFNKNLYEGIINNPKELNSLQKRIDVLKEEMAEYDEKIFKEMQLKEQLEEELNGLSQQLKKQYNEFKKVKLTYNGTKLNMEQELVEILEEKEKVLSQVEEKYLTWYNEKRHQYSGKPIGKIMENHACSGCYRILPITIVKKARNSPGMVYCENCGRMLYASKIL